MVAIDRLKGRKLDPLGQQIRRWRTGKAAHVRAGKRKATQPQVHQLGHGHAQVIPGGAVVASPGDGVALASGVAGTRHHKRPLVRPQRKLTLLGGAGVLHTKNVVDLKVGRGALAEAGFVDPMLDVVWHRLARAIENRRLIHVVPEAGDAILNEILEESAPPLPCLRLGKVGKDRGPRPNLAHVDRAVRVLHKVVPRNPRVIRRVAHIRLPGHMQVCDHHQLEMLVAPDPSPCL